MNTLFTILFFINEISRLSGSLVLLLICASLFTALLVMLVCVLKRSHHE